MLRLIILNCLQATYQPLQHISAAGLSQVLWDAPQQFAHVRPAPSETATCLQDSPGCRCLDTPVKTWVS